MIHDGQSYAIPLISRPVSHVSRDESKASRSFVRLAVSCDWNVPSGGYQCELCEPVVECNLPKDSDTAQLDVLCRHYTSKTK
jgi:hypothetical protein